MTLSRVFDIPCVYTQNDEAQYFGEGKMLFLFLHSESKIIFDESPEFKVKGTGTYFGKVLEYI